MERSPAKPSTALHAMLLVVTRIHCAYADDLPDADTVAGFVRSCREYADHVLVCLGVGESSVVHPTGNCDQSGKSREPTSFPDAVQLYSRAIAMDSFVSFLDVRPWGYFTTALNSAVLFAQDHGFDLIAFQSLEFRSSCAVVETLRGQFHENTLVVGCAVAGHEFEEGEHILTGRKCPWNTMAIWNVDFLSMNGFPMVGDGTGCDRASGGVEEVAAISILQLLSPSLEALLIKVEDVGMSWATEFNEKERNEYHSRKMASKNQRPAQQLQRLGIAPGRVRHILVHR